MNPKPNDPDLQAQLVEPPKKSSAGLILAILAGVGAFAFIAFVGLVLLMVALLVPAVQKTREAASRQAAANAAARAPADGSELHITDDNFDAQVLNATGSQTIVVDFYADWCGPCRMQTPILAKFAASNPDVKIAKVDVDACPKIAARYQISSIPTLYIVKKGEIVTKHVGLADENELARLVKK